MTPAVLSLSGKCELSPPNMRWPTCRLGYCTTIRRWARSIKTMNAITPKIMTSSKMMNAADKAPVRPSSSVLARAVGRLATMPEKMISEMPLPMPRAVICSPNHISKIVPPEIVTTVLIRKKKPGQ